MAWMSRQVGTKIRCNSQEQLGRDEAVVESVARSRNVGQIERPIVFDSIRRVEIGLERRQSEMLRDA